MPRALGAIIGLSFAVIIWGYTGMIGGLLGAFANVLMGRFFFASVCLAISIFCGSYLYPEQIQADPEHYKILLMLGLLLEGMKWGFKLWGPSFKQLIEPPKASSEEPLNIVINVTDDPQKKF